MWFFSIYSFLNIKHKYKKIFYIYTNLLYIIISSFIVKEWNKYCFTSKNLVSKAAFYLLLEHKIINIKYKGKIFKIKKKKKLFFLLLNYTGFNYVIWKDIKIKKRKRKKIIFIYTLTNSNIKINFFQNLIRLRRLNTYTKRGVYNNLYIHYARKRKISTHR
jgi:hypothetical protein